MESQRSAICLPSSMRARRSRMDSTSIAIISSRKNRRLARLWISPEVVAISPPKSVGKMPANVTKTERLIAEPDLPKTLASVATLDKEKP